VRSACFEFHSVVSRLRSWRLFFGVEAEEERNSVERMKLLGVLVAVLLAVLMSLNSSEAWPVSSPEMLAVSLRGFCGSFGSELEWKKQRRLKWSEGERSRVPSKGLRIQEMSSKGVWKF
jgi:hypothetical protein